MTKPNYEISFSKYAYYDTDIRDSTDIILESPVLLKEHKDLKNTIISHMGAINNATIHEYFAIKNTTKDKVTIKIPTYPMLPFPVAIKESIKRHSIYNDIKNKYKNKSELDRYIEKAKRETDIQWRIHKSVDNNIIVNNCFLVHDNHVYFPEYIVFPFVKSLDDKEFVLDEVFNKNTNIYTIYCNMMFKKDISIG